MYVKLHGVTFRGKKNNNNKHLLHLDFPKSHELNFFLPDVVTDDPGSKPGQKYARRRDRQNYVGRIN